MASTQKEVLIFLKTLTERLPQASRQPEPMRNTFNTPGADNSARRIFVDEETRSGAPAERNQPSNFVTQKDLERLLRNRYKSDFADMHQHQPPYPPEVQFLFREDTLLLNSPCMTAPSLTGRAYTWYNKIAPNNIPNWGDMVTAFYKKYFFVSEQITFSDLGRMFQRNNEHPNDYVKRFRIQALDCHDPNVTEQQLVNSSINGMVLIYRTLLENLRFDKHMASSTEGPSIPVDDPDESMATVNPTTVESISTATPSSLVEVSKPPKASGKKQSDCWQHFDKRLDIKPPKVQCKHCKRKFSWGKDDIGGSNSHGTTNMNNHIKQRRCPNYTPPGQQQLAFQVSDNGETRSVVNHSFDQDACRASLTRMIIKDELSFMFVQREGFLEFCHQLEPRFDVPSRFTEAKDCMKMYLSEYHKLKAEFKKYGRRLCLTTDTWTSVTNMSYMVLTGHYIDEKWVLKKKILNFCPVTDHTGLELGKTVAACLLQWGIERVFTFTVDNISSVQTSRSLEPQNPINRFVESEKHQETVEGKTELDMYFSEKREDFNQQFDILNWWKVNSSKYKILSMISRDVLAMQVSTVASESSFSTGGRVLNEFRSSMLPKTVQALICAQNWLLDKPINLEELIEAVEKIDLDGVSRLRKKCSSKKLKDGLLWVKQDIRDASYNQQKASFGCTETALQLLAELPETRNRKEGVAAA
ncbi:hypothetical protein C5167_023374 [Papaver somniferum]|uniref:BED-type domain-containing protein n=1 Tax=Papaver somniferum TaxID=3469 RepID=A0A4Y7JP78_PAPSO|nr:hypothetical protein C5167_023374 [Papaver somniferum]